jgi:hypothetical protein
MMGLLSVGYFAQKRTEILTDLSMKLHAKASKIIHEMNFVNIHNVNGYCEGKRCNMKRMMVRGYFRGNRE